MILCPDSCNVYQIAEVASLIKFMNDSSGLENRTIDKKYKINELSMIIRPKIKDLV